MPLAATLLASVRPPVRRRFPILCGLLLAAPASIAQLSGLYTIHPLRPVTATNFQNLYSAVDALAAQGVSGPTNFELYDDGGPFVDPMVFYSAAHPTLGQNLALGNNQCILRLGAWTGVSSVNRVIFRAAPGESPTLDATGQACGVYFNGADYVTLEGLEIKNAAFDAISLYTASSQNALGNRIVGCTLRNCGGVGVLCYGNAGAVNDTFIANNLFSNMMQTGGGSFSGFIRDSYVAGRRDNNTQILFNTFLVGTLAGTSIATPPSVFGSYPGSTTYTAFTKVEGNVVVKSTANGVVYNFQTASATTAPTLPASADWNCFWLPAGGNFAKGAATTYATLPAWQTGVTKDGASLSADPLLAGCGTPAYRLPIASPCVNAGVTTSVDPALWYDREGFGRDSLIDIGADEWQGNPAACAGFAGSGGPGASGEFQALLPSSPPEIGNGGFAFVLPRATGGVAAFVYLAFGLETVPVFYGAGNRSYLNQADLAALAGTPLSPLTVGFAAPTGGLSAPFPIPNDTALVGATLYFQASQADAGAPLGFTLTNALSLTFQ